jgi:hypothetical protein
MTRCNGFTTVAQGFSPAGAAALKGCATIDA